MRARKKHSKSYPLHAFQIPLQQRVQSEDHVVAEALELEQRIFNIHMSHKDKTQTADRSYSQMMSVNFKPAFTYYLGVIQLHPRHIKEPNSSGSHGDDEP